MPEGEGEEEEEEDLKEEWQEEEEKEDWQEEEEDEDEEDQEEEDANGGEWQRIESATLVEMNGAPVRYAGTAALILETIAPRARLRVIACEKVA